jgi:tetratricopeptide (TPR) repeat protein
MLGRFLTVVSLSAVSVTGIFLSLTSGLADDVWRKPATLETLRSAAFLAPGNPRIKGSIGRLQASNPDVLNFEDSERALRQAVAMAPADFRLWMRLGETLSLVGKFQEAESAYKRAVELAPQHFEPQWRFANMLLAAGKVDESSPYIRRSLSLDETKAPAMLDLCWQISNGDQKYVSSLILDSPTLQLQYVKLLVRKGRLSDAVSYWKSLDDAKLKAVAKPAREFINQLISQKEYDAAWDIWTTLPDIKLIGVSKGRVWDGEFRLSVSKNPCFEWKFESRQKGAELTIDTAGPSPNVNALRIAYASDGRAFDHASQIILLSPGKYRLSYYARSEEIVTGSLPTVEIADASKANGWRVRSQPSLAGSQPWKKNELVFTVEPDVKAISVAVRRPSECGTAEGCPIFGTVWFAGIVIEPI